MDEPLLQDASVKAGGPEGASPISVVITLGVTTMGAGILSLPIATAYCGSMTTGVAFLGIFALAADYALVLIVRAARNLRVSSLGDLGHACYGSFGSSLVSGTLITLLFGAMVTIMIVIGDVIPPPIQYFALGAEYRVSCPAFDCAAPLWWAGTVRCDIADTCAPPPFALSRLAICACLVALTYPLTLFRDLTSLRLTSSFAISAVFFVVLALCVRWGSAGTAASARTFEFDWSSLVLAFPIQALSYCCVFNILGLDRELRPRNKKDIYSIIHASMLLVVFPMYAAASIAGYMQFGDETFALQDILGGFPSHDNLMLCASLAIGATNVLKFPLIALPFRDTLNDALGITIRDSNGNAGRLSFPVLAVEMFVILTFGLMFSILLQDLAVAFEILGAHSFLPLLLMSTLKDKNELTITQHTLSLTVLVNLLQSLHAPCLPRDL
jgi:amino acid permease